MGVSTRSCRCLLGVSGRTRVWLSSAGKTFWASLLERFKAERQNILSHGQPILNDADVGHAYAKDTSRAQHEWPEECSVKAILHTATQATAERLDCVISASAPLVPGGHERRALSQKASGVALADGRAVPLIGRVICEQLRCEDPRAPAPPRPASPAASPRRRLAPPAAAPLRLPMINK